MKSGDVLIPLSEPGIGRCYCPDKIRTIPAETMRKRFGSHYYVDSDYQTIHEALGKPDETWTGYGAATPGGESRIFPATPHGLEQAKALARVERTRLRDNRIVVLEKFFSSPRARFLMFRAKVRLLRRGKKFLENIAKLEAELEKLTGERAGDDLDNVRIEKIPERIRTYPILEHGQKIFRVDFNHIGLTRSDLRIDELVIKSVYISDRRRWTPNPDAIDYDISYEAADPRKLAGEPPAGRIYLRGESISFKRLEGQFWDNEELPTSSPITGIKVFMTREGAEKFRRAKANEIIESLQSVIAQDG